MNNASFSGRYTEGKFIGVIILIQLICRVREWTPRRLEPLLCRHEPPRFARQTEPPLYRPSLRYADRVSSIKWTSLHHTEQIFQILVFMCNEKCFLIIFLKAPCYFSKHCFHIFWLYSCSYLYINMHLIYLSLLLFSSWIPNSLFDLVLGLFIILCIITYLHNKHRASRLLSKVAYFSMSYLRKMSSSKYWKVKSKNDSIRDFIVHYFGVGLGKV